MQNRKQLIFILGILLIVIVAGATALTQERILRDGVEVVLETRPVDPRDLFRGEYVILRYAIEVDPYVLSYAEMLPPGSDLYIKLYEGPGGVAKVEEVRQVRPRGAVGAWIRGEINGAGEVRFPSLEQFYVPEGAGAPIEDLRNELHARVVIDDAGSARVVELLDGNLTPIDPFEYREKTTVPVNPDTRPVTAPVE